MNSDQRSKLWKSKYLNFIAKKEQNKIEPKTKQNNIVKNQENLETGRGEREREATIHKLVMGAAI